jgi:hypothetical protein
VSFSTDTPIPADRAAIPRTTAEPPTRVRPAVSPTPPLSLTPAVIAAQGTSAVAPSPTPQSVARQQATPSPTLGMREATPTVSSPERGDRSDYVLFGVLLAILVAVIVAIVARRSS